MIRKQITFKVSVAPIENNDEPQDANIERVLERYLRAVVKQAMRHVATEQPNDGSPPVEQPTNR